MTIWDRLRGRERPAPGTRLHVADESSEELSDGEARRADRLLRELASRNAGETIPATDLLGAADRLAAGGHGRLAADRLLGLANARAGDPALSLRIAEWILARHEDRRAERLLEGLVDHLEHGPTARRALGRALAARGAQSESIAHQEAALAADITLPGLLTELRALGGRSPPAQAGASLLAGTIVGGEGLRALGERYRLIGELGRGASSTVYRAHDEELDRDVALKLLHPHLYGSRRGRALAYFFAEARLAASVPWPGVVAIYDLDEERKMLVMEWCPGGSLRARLRQSRVSPAVAIAWAMELLASLALLHERGITHGDLKPGNLLFRGTANESSSELVFADFGAAHLLADRTSSDPEPPAGTLAYLSPERRRGEAGGAPSDVFAAGLVLHELFTGQPATLLPRLTPDRVALAELIDHVALPIHAGLRSLIAGCLAGTIERRPTAAEALRRVEQMVGLAGGSTRRA